MKVKMLVMMSGPLQVREKGFEYDIPDAEAARMCAAGFAERCEDRESAAMATPRRRRVSAKDEGAEL